MKHIIKSTLVLVLVLAMAMGLCACSTGAEKDLWADALYKADTELGEGAVTFTIKVEAQEKSVTFTINTDAETVGAALMEHNLLEGDMGDFGLYVKKVNGMEADYDVDQTYWAFYIGEDYAMSGVDLTEIDPTAAYRLVRTK